MDLLYEIKENKSLQEIGMNCSFPITRLQSPVKIAQWDSSLSLLPVARVQFPAIAEYFKGFFPGRSHSANPS